MSDTNLDEQIAEYWLDEESPYVAHEDVKRLIQEAIAAYVEPHIKGCEIVNGLSYCKNCGLTRLEESSE